MRGPAREERFVRRLCRNYLVSILLMGLHAAPTTTSAQVTVIETGLHGNESIYGVDAPPEPVPFVNLDSILVSGTGETDASLYAIVSFSAYGLRAPGPVVSSSDIGVTAAGGVGGAEPFTDVMGRTRGYGIFAEGTIDNSGGITVTVSGPTINADGVGDSHARALGFMYGTGLYSGDAVQNEASIDVSITGGTVGMNAHTMAPAYAYSEARASAFAKGIETGGSIENTGDVSVEATGSDTHNTGHGANHALLESIAHVYGLWAGEDVENEGTIGVSATAGAANASGLDERYLSAHASAEATAIYSENSVQNQGDLTSSSAGGSAIGSGYSDAYASATAGGYGVRAETHVDNTGGVVGTATGGSAQSSGSIDTGYPFADVDAQGRFTGIYAEHGDVNNSGDMLITASGGRAEAQVEGPDHSRAEALASARVEGIFAGGYTGKPLVRNTGSISVTAAAGYAAAETLGYDAEARAGAAVFGIGGYAEVQNGNAITATATGGTAGAYGEPTTDGVWVRAYAGAYGDGIDTRGDVNNVADIAVTATAGNAAAQVQGDEARADAGAEATARGLVSREGGVDNSGDVTIEARGGTADANGVSAAHATADSEACGIDAGGEINNSGTVTLDVQAGAAGVSDANEVSNSARADAYGIRGDDDVTNSGAVYTEATGGATLSRGPEGVGAVRANTGAGATGVLAEENVYNFGTVDVAAQRGTDNPYSKAIAYGVYAKGVVDNDGVVSATAEGGTIPSGVSAEAVGVGIDGGAVENSGEITTSAVGGGAHAYGVSGTGSEVSNAGTITAAADGGTADPAEAIVFEASSHAYGVDGLQASALNTGTIRATAGGGTVDAAGVDNSNAIADANAYGIRSEAPVVNDGVIEASATAGSVNASAGGAHAHAWGVHSKYRTITNNTQITTAATGGQLTCTSFDPNNATDAAAISCGMYTQEGTIHNNGTIVAAAWGGSIISSGADAPQGALASARACGLQREGRIQFTKRVNNTGQISATAIGGTVQAQSGQIDASASAYGIKSEGVPIYNSGGIAASATGGTAAGHGVVGANADAEAYAIYGRGTGTDRDEMKIWNTGDITVTANGGVAEGTDSRASASAFGLFADVMHVDNSGSVGVTATTRDAVGSEACGVYVTGDSTLTNTGIIRAWADTAHELHVSGGTTTLIHTYNVTLDGEPNDASILVADGAKLALNRARLTVAGVDGETQWDTEYRLFETEGTGVVEGSWTRAEARNPNAFVAYNDQDSSNPADDTVALTYSPPASVALPSATIDQQMVSRAMDIVNRRMTTEVLLDVFSSPYSALLADAGPTSRSMILGHSSSDPQGSFFIEPYLGRADRDADPLGYDARLWGFSGGYQRRLENTLLGLHIGYGQADIDYSGEGYSANSEDQDVLTGGFSGLTRWDAWTVRYGATGFYGRHEYRGLTGMLLGERETADFNSHGLAATVMAGHVFRRGSHAFLPEAGLSWLWVHRDRYTTDATDPGWNATFSAMDDHDVYAEAAMRWLGSFLHGDVHVLPMVSVGVRHLLTDADVSVSQSVPGASPVLVELGRARTGVTLSGSVALTKGRHSLSVAYDSELSSDTYWDSVWLRFSWLF